MKNEEQFVVVPGPGLGDDKVKVVSRHRTLQAAQRAAEIATQDFREAMATHGGSSGYFYAAEHGDDVFWADSPPRRLSC